MKKKGFRLKEKKRTCKRDSETSNNNDKEGTCRIGVHYYVDAHYLENKIASILLLTFSALELSSKRVILRNKSSVKSKKLEQV